MFTDKTPVRFTISCLFVLLCVATAVGQGSAPKKLPSADKIVDNYLKAIGGRKAVAAQRDVTYEWTIEFNNQPIGTARTLRKAPASERLELTFGNGQIISASNARSAWEIGLDKQLRTLTSLEAATAKLQAILDASRFVDFKKLNVLARVVSLEANSAGHDSVSTAAAKTTTPASAPISDPVYLVEFSTRSGARLQYYFSVKSKLITKITSDTKKTRLVFEDYRAENGLLEPHRMRMTLPGTSEIAKPGNPACSCAASG